MSLVFHECTFVDVSIGINQASSALSETLDKVAVVLWDQVPWLDLSFDVLNNIAETRRSYLVLLCHFLSFIQFEQLLFRRTT